MSKEGVKVRILDRNFTIACPPGEQASVEAAAEYLNDQLENMRTQSKVIGLEHTLVLAALNIANELLSKQSQMAASSHGGVLGFFIAFLAVMKVQAPFAALGLGHFDAGSFDEWHERPGVWNSWRAFEVPLWAMVGENSLEAVEEASPLVGIALLWIFNPVDPRRFGPVTLQGCFLRRQPEVYKRQSSSSSSSSSIFGRFLLDVVLSLIHISEPTRLLSLGDCGVWV